MGRIGGGELLLILLIALLIFGPSKLADMGKGLGEGLKNFKKGISQGDEPDGESKPGTPPTAAPPEPPKALTAGPVEPAAAPEAPSSVSAGVSAAANATKPGES